MRIGIDVAGISAGDVGLERCFCRPCSRLLVF